MQEVYVKNGDDFLWEGFDIKRKVLRFSLMESDDDNDNHDCATNYNYIINHHDNIINHDNYIDDNYIDDNYIDNHDDDNGAANLFGTARHDHNDNFNYDYHSSAYCAGCADVSYWHFW